MPANSTTRHAVARSTGSSTLARKQEDGTWNIECLNHGATTTAPNRGAAWKVAPKPEAWCPKCGAIAEGKAEKITAGLLGIPASASTKKAAPKTRATPAKKATTK